MKNKKFETRMYPQCCTSAFCGGGGEDCLTCRFADQKNKFDEWATDNKAIQPDMIWSPSLYQATV